MDFQSIALPTELSHHHSINIEQFPFGAAKIGSFVLKNTKQKNHFNYCIKKDRKLPVFLKNRHH
jgi:hypothetical protein